MVDRSQADLAALLADQLPRDDGGGYQLDGMSVGLGDEQITATSVASGVDLVDSPFCVTWDTAPVATVVLAAPSPGLAVDTMAALVASANAGEASRGAPGLWGFSLGVCPVGEPSS